MTSLAARHALDLLRDSRDGLRIFAPGEVEQLAALAGVGVTVVRVDLTMLATERVEIAPPPGSDGKGATA